MTLLVLAIGLVLGALCAAVWARLKRIEAESAMALQGAADAAKECQYSDARVKILGDQLNKHDHEIATLYDRQQLRRN